MEPTEEEVRTDIAEEKALAPAKRGRRLWFFVTLGVALLLVAAAVLIVAIRHRRDGLPRLTTEELEQLKYDADERERERQKAAQIRDQSFLVRKEDDSQAQANSLLKDLDMDKDSGRDLSAKLSDREARAEEEAIAHVLRGSLPVETPPPPSPEPRRKDTQPVQKVAAPDTGSAPMFIYSRTFGGAKYVDAPQKQTVQSLQSTSADPTVDTSVRASKAAPAKPQDSERSVNVPGEEKASLLYTDYPPVTLYEGEMLEAVLVNRIIADTEPSPVICQIAKDVFDHSAEYVVFPASSRIVGFSQVVTYKGAARLFISFHRIILPNGPSVDLPSGRKALKALDETGALGVVSKVERHWFLQFGTAIFFGVLDGLSGAAQRSRDVLSTRAVVFGRTSENFNRILENIMAQYSTIVPTIRVDQGKKLKLYLSEDILISPYAKISERSYYASR